MISSQYKFIFIHAPKTGGNSIQSILKSFSDDDIVIVSDHQDGVERFETRNKNYGFTKHSTLSNYKWELPRQIYSSMFKFSTIRNPWDRMVSFYFSPHREVKEFNRDEFAKLIQSVPTLRYSISTKSITQKIVSRFGLPFSGDFGKKPLGSELDYLIRFENLENDFKAVCKKIGIPPCSLPKRNSSKRQDYPKYYDEELAEMVSIRFSEEIKLGGYCF